MARSLMPKHASKPTPEPCVDAISRLLLIFAGLICAAAGAAISLPFLAFIDPLVREAILSFFMGSLLTVFGTAPGPAEATGFLMALMRGSTLAICVGPVALAALIGELARLRSLLCYACCSGLIAAAMPFDLHPWAEAERGEAAPERAAMMLEIRFMLLFFVVGLVAGSIYWLIAGRNAGEATIELEWRAK